MASLASSSPRPRRSRASRLWARSPLPARSATSTSALPPTTGAASIPSSPSGSTASPRWPRSRRPCRRPPDRMGVNTADEIIAWLGLKPHPEGGHYCETFRAPDSPRGASTAIYFLLKAGERSHWHRVDADEIWQHYAGAPLELSLSEDGKTVRQLRLGADFDL